jgi:hypothetical protein
MILHDVNILPWHITTKPIQIPCSDQTKIIPPTLDAKVIELKPCNLSDVLHILKALEYALAIIPHPMAYYFIYQLQTCILVGFAPPMLNAHILVDNFQHMLKI